MPNDFSVIDIATRRKTSGSFTVGPGRVSRIAAEIVTGLRTDPQRPLPATHLSLTLEDLTGLADRTVRNLTIAVESGLLTAASAARLAMRHAREIGGTERYAEPPSDRLGTWSVELVIVGSPFDEFAMRLGPTGSGLVVGVATAGHLREITSLLRKVDPAILVAAGRDADGRFRAGVTTAATLGTAVSRILLSSRWRFAEHVLALGGAVPHSFYRRRTLAFELEAVLANGGVLPPLGRRFHRAQFFDDQDPTDILVLREALDLIEVAFPGLVHSRAAAFEGPEGPAATRGGAPPAQAPPA